MMSERDAIIARDIINKAVGEFGVVAVAEMLGRDVETIRFWQVLPATCGEEHLPPYGDLRALALRTQEKQRWMEKGFD